MSFWTSQPFISVTCLCSASKSLRISSAEDAKIACRALFFTQKQISFLHQEPNLLKKLFLGCPFRRFQARRRAEVANWLLRHGLGFAQELLPF
mmetsp:Transcript_41789/g.98985  ORF Transcript_41789/g.98985 Transcript_41789/m.98985 type:complete len:93 (+) Transcript_41789:364-642(+)